MKETYIQALHLCYEHGVNNMAAAVSYYALFSITPLLFGTIYIVSLLYGEEFVVTTLYDWGSVLGVEILSLLHDAVQNLEMLTVGIGASVLSAVFFGLMVLLFFNTVTAGLHRLWGIPYQGVPGLLRKTARSFVFVVILEVYLLFLVGLSAVSSFFSGMIGGTLFALVEPLFFILTTAVLFSLAYRILPTSAPSGYARLYGGLVASALFFITKWFVSLYVSTTPIPGLFGAAGLMLVLLIWVYMSALVVYFGAAVAHVYDGRDNIQKC